jgi:hypothetical protein
MNEKQRCNIALIKERADKPHLLFHGAQSTLNSAVLVGNHEISPGKRAPATQEVGPCGQAYGGSGGMYR